MESNLDIEKKAEFENKSLLDVIFSWSLRDILNKDLYKGKVAPIPRRFSSTRHYKESFMDPLIVETHADLLSKITNVCNATTFEVKDVNIYSSNSKQLYCQIRTRRVGESVKDEELCELQEDDLIAMTDMKPKYVSDLNRPSWPFLIASVQRFNNEDFFNNEDNDDNKFTILTSRPLTLESLYSKTGRIKIFVVHLTNLRTNNRIWKALHWKSGNMNIIENVLQIDPSAAGLNCSSCSLEEIDSAILAKQAETIGSFNLDDSQEAAVVNCLTTSACCHRCSVKLLWGPPGTGKTKTVASLLFVLLKMKCRTLTCAPTNIAMLGVTKRLMSVVRDTCKYDTYGFGDIVLYGNEKNMKINDHADLLDIFLQNRVSRIWSFLCPLSGWSSVESMILILEDPEHRYNQYRLTYKQSGKHDLGENKSKVVPRHKKGLVNWYKESDGNNAAAEDKQMDSTMWTFQEFITRKFNIVAESLMRCIKNMYTHLPTTVISVEVTTKMIRALELL